MKPPCKASFLFNHDMMAVGHTIRNVLKEKIWRSNGNSSRKGISESIDPDNNI